MVSNGETGLTDFSINEKFARKLEDASKRVAGLSQRLSEKAAVIVEKCDTARDRKVNMQDIILVREITDFKQKCAATKKGPHKKFVPSQDFWIKLEWISDDEDDQEAAPQEFPGELDGHFAYPKENENPAEVHNFICDHCDGVFRDRNELRNHYTNHRIKFFQCLICDNISRSVRSFETHKKSHESGLHVCLVCQKGFRLKTSLTNHEQTHSEERMKCSHPGCNKSFKNRQNKWNMLGGVTETKKNAPVMFAGNFSKHLQTCVSIGLDSMVKLMTSFLDTQTYHSTCCNTLINYSKKG